MKVNNHRGVLVVLGLWSVGHRAQVGLHLLHHLLLQRLGVEDERAGRLVVLDDGVDECGLLEEVVLLEGVELVELHGVDAEL